MMKSYLPYRIIKPVFWITLAAVLTALPVSWIFAGSPFHDVRDYFEWGWCDGLATAEACEAFVTPARIFFMFFIKLSVYVWILFLSVGLFVRFGYRTVNGARENIHR